MNDPSFYTHLLKHDGRTDKYDFAYRPFAFERALEAKKAMKSILLKAGNSFTQAYLE